MWAGGVLGCSLGEADGHKIGGEPLALRCQHLQGNEGQAVAKLVESRVSRRLSQPPMEPCQHPMRCQLRVTHEETEAEGSDSHSQEGVELGPEPRALGWGTVDSPPPSWGPVGAMLAPLSAVLPCAELFRAWVPASPGTRVGALGPAVRAALPGCRAAACAGGTGLRGSGTWG